MMHRPSCDKKLDSERPVPSSVVWVIGRSSRSWLIDRHYDLSADGRVFAQKITQRVSGLRDGLKGLGQTSITSRILAGLGLVVAFLVLASDFHYP